MKLDFYIKNLKVSFLSLIVGVVTGAICAFFGRVLISITDFRYLHYNLLIPFLPFAGLVTIFSYHKISKKSMKGMGLVFDVANIDLVDSQLAQDNVVIGNDINKKVGLNKSNDLQKTSIPLLLVPLVMANTWISHLFGASVGREGVAVQIGATISNFLGNLLDGDMDKETYVKIGMAAGFSGLFQTPIAAIFFALEVLKIGKMDYRTLLPLIISSFSASYTSRLLGLEKFQVPITRHLIINPMVGAKLIIIGLIFAIMGIIFVVSVSKLKKLNSKYLTNPYIRIFTIAIIISVLSFLLMKGRYCGLGTNLISSSFGGEEIYSYDFVLKMLLTVLSLSCGFQGGEVTPLFSIGATLGMMLGSILGLDPFFCSALGYAAMFTSSANVLLAGIFIGCEVFGFINFPAFFIVCSVAYFFNFGVSMYGGQARIKF